LAFLHRHKGAIPYLLLAPGLGFLALFFVVPLYYLVSTSLQTGSIDVGYTFDWAWHNYADAVSGYQEQFLRSIWYAGVATLIALGAYVWSQNDRYFSDFNITSVMFACAALGFISLGQTFALLLGGIDLSVGPLAGFLVVVASFFVLDGKSTAVWALGFVAMLLLWDEGSAYWQVGLAYALVGIGVGFAGTPASHSLTGSVPVQRAGMASGTADLQRDLGGAIMQSILGALLTAGYAAAITAAIATAPNQEQITDGVASQLTKSFAGAEAIAAQYPQYASEITAAAKSSFLDGADWAYTAGIVAIVLGGALVYWLFPKRAKEEELLARYHAEDTGELRPG